MRDEDFHRRESGKENKELISGILADSTVLLQVYRTESEYPELASSGGALTLHSHSKIQELIHFLIHNSGHQLIGVCKSVSTMLLMLLVLNENQISKTVQ